MCCFVSSDQADVTCIIRMAGLLSLARAK
uniref:Uncharacterized protein n=1 Tax=Arundo donax TaxID=35708 RepID=A0A0A9HDM9_ARUDO